MFLLTSDQATHQLATSGQWMPRKAKDRPADGMALGQGLAWGNAWAEPDLPPGHPGPRTAMGDRLPSSWDRFFLLRPARFESGRPHHVDEINETQGDGPICLGNGSIAYACVGTSRCPRW